MAKFKVGDKVRVRSDLNEKDRYYNEDKETWDNCVSEMLDLSGKAVTIKEIGRTGKYRICEEGYSWTDEMFSGLAAEQPRREFIVIRRSGAETIAELRHDREVIKSAKATCAPSDTFDLDTGAKLAFDRLMGREEPKPAPQPAHRFKVGERVVAKRGNGTILLTDETTHNGCILVAVDDYVCGHNGYPWTEDAGIFKDRRDCMWDSEENLSPAPAPEPPKFYTGKVFAEKSTGPLFESRDGKIFEFVDGECVNAGFKDSMNGEIRNINHLRKMKSCTTWHEVKEPSNV